MNLSPEHRLLLACAGANASGADLRVVGQTLAHSKPDWDSVTAAALLHGIAPLVYHALARSGLISFLPPGSARVLRATYYGNAARNALLYRELRTMLHSFSERGIGAIILKGAALAQSVYPDPALRPMADIDLLVKREQLSRVESALVELGFSFEEQAKAKEFYLDRHYHWVFTKRSAVPVEVHWHIQRPNGPFRIAIEHLWERARPIRFAGVEALSLSPEDSLLHVCQHMHKHNLMGGIRPLCDIAHLLSHCQGGIDWAEFICRCDEWQLAPFAYIALSACQGLLGADIPCDALNRLEPAAFHSAVLDWAKDRLLNRESSSVSSNVVELCRQGGRLRDRAAALAKALRPAPTAPRHDVSPAANLISLLHYPRRIRYLIARYGPLLWRSVAGNGETRHTLEKEYNQLQLTRWLSESLRNN